jgi:hypothetical protein
MYVIFAGVLTLKTGGILSTENPRVADCDTWPLESLQYTTIWCPPSGTGTMVVFVVKKTLEPPSILYQLASTVALNRTVKGMPVPLAYVVFAGAVSVIVIAPDLWILPPSGIVFARSFLPAGSRLKKFPEYRNKHMARNTRVMENTNMRGERGDLPAFFRGIVDHRSWFVVLS